MKCMSFVLFVSLVFFNSCEIMPENTIEDCVAQCKDNKKPKACLEFCDCIHKEGKPLDSCLAKYNQDRVDSLQTNK